MLAKGEVPKSLGRGKRRDLNGKVEDECRNARKSIKDGDCFHMLAVYSVRLRGSALHTCQQRLTVPTGKGWFVDFCNSIHSALGTSGTECGEDESVSTGLVIECSTRAVPRMFRKEPRLRGGQSAVR